MFDVTMSTVNWHSSACWSHLLTMAFYQLGHSSRLFVISRQDMAAYWVLICCSIFNSTPALPQHSTKPDPVYWPKLCKTTTAPQRKAQRTPNWFNVGLMLFMWTLKRPLPTFLVWLAVPQANERQILMKERRLSIFDAGEMTEPRMIALTSKDNCLMPARITTPIIPRHASGSKVIKL